MLHALWPIAYAVILPCQGLLLQFGNGKMEGEAMTQATTNHTAHTLAEGAA